MKVSVITAVYNGESTVAEALASVLAQSHTDRELIVIDGASKDGTMDVLDSFARQIDLLVSEPDQGIYDALNKGIRRATGDVVGFLHADDVYADSRVLERITRAFADPAVAAVYGDLVYTSRNHPDRVIRYWRAGEFTPAKLGRGWMPPHPTLYVRRKYYEQLGAFDTSYRIAADYDFMLRLLRTPGIKCCYLPQVLVKMRVGGASNRSLANILLKSREDYRALQANGIGGLKALVLKNIGKIGQFLPRG